MLVLTRRAKDSITILRDGKVILEFVIMDVSHSDNVRIGFTAEPEVKIMRSELLEKTDGA